MDCLRNWLHLCFAEGELSPTGFSDDSADRKCRVTVYAGLKKTLAQPGDSIVIPGAGGGS